MLKYIVKRTFQMIPTVIGVILLTFVLFNIVPNDLAAISLGKNVTLEMLQTFDEQRGLDRPLFFGTRARTRAYETQRFSEGAGRWSNWSNAVHNAQAGTITLLPGAAINPLAFELGDERTFEWEIRFRGAGELAGISLFSNGWKTQKIEFRGSDEAGFKTAGRSLEIKSLELHRMQSSVFDSQLVFYIRQLLRGDFGYSDYFKQPVSKLLLDGVLPSLSLTVPIFVIGVIVSLALSLVCAFYRNHFIDRSLVVFSVALMSINYLIYIVAGQYFFAYRQGWFPVWGYESVRYLFLPVLIGVVSGLGTNIRFYRTIMLDEMYKDYVRTAFAKGVPKSRALFVHVFKNAMIPVITNVVIALPFLYTGSLLLEKFFGIPGLGYLGVNAVLSSDVDVVRALVLIGAMLFVVANLISDICYAAVDPRVKLK